MIAVRSFSLAKRFPQQSDCLGTCCDRPGGQVLWQAPNPDQRPGTFFFKWKLPFQHFWTNDQEAWAGPASCFIGETKTFGCVSSATCTHPRSFRGHGSIANPSSKSGVSQKFGWHGSIVNPSFKSGGMPEVSKGMVR